MSSSSNVFSAFCAAWVERFPDAELPDKWEDDVRDNLQRHQQRVLHLQQELDKERLYVEYLHKLVTDIEQRRQANEEVVNHEDDEKVEIADDVVAKSRQESLSSSSSPPSSLSSRAIKSRSENEIISKGRPTSTLVASKPSRPPPLKRKPTSFSERLRPTSIKTTTTTMSGSAVTVEQSPQSLRSSSDSLFSPRETLVHLEENNDDDDDDNNSSDDDDDEDEKSSKSLPNRAARMKELMESWEKRAPIVPNNVANNKSNEKDIKTVDANIREEPLYDAVATDEDEEYDNHLLMYEKSSSVITEAEESSSSVEESNYVNIQFFLNNNDKNKLSTNNLKDEDDDHDIDDNNDASAYKSVLDSILESEAIYLEALSVLLQYMKAMKVTLTTPQPVIPRSEFELIFHRVPELHELHLTFYEKLRKELNDDKWRGVDTHVGSTFKMLASRTKIYTSYLNNYPKALEALHRCNASYPQFADLTHTIKLGSKSGQSVSLEELLHRPVARLQKTCLSIQDLIARTPNHPDHSALTLALTQVQKIVSEYNSLHAHQMFPSDAEILQRHLVKNSFVVEMCDNHRKLRHLFLFNDALVCAKYKMATNKQERFSVALKWFIPLSNALIVESSSSSGHDGGLDNSTNSSALLQLKTQAATLRDQLMLVTSDDGSQTTIPTTAVVPSTVQNNRTWQKLRKKLSEVESQLVLELPHLLFQVANKDNGKAYSFYMSSEYERSQWIESIHVLQTALAQQQVKNSGASKLTALNNVELESWITDCRNVLKTNMGSFLMRSPRDEPLLVGDLTMTIHGLQGDMAKTSSNTKELHIVIEVDSYGHFFKKAKTRSLNGNETFVIDLDGSENLRLLALDKSNGCNGRASLQLSLNWLNNENREQPTPISLGNNLVLNCSLSFEPNNRVPIVAQKKKMSLSSSNASVALFGASLESTCRRERRSLPFVISCCVREVERRGLAEVGIYRVSGSNADVLRLKRAFESNPYEAEQVAKECDIHSVASTLKQFLRELPETIFTLNVYKQLFETHQQQQRSFGPSKHLEARVSETLLELYMSVPGEPNRVCIDFLIEHMVRISHYEKHNKMSLHNLATVFGPSLLHDRRDHNSKRSINKHETIASSTVDVMAQAAILHFFLQRKAKLMVQNTNTP